MSQIFVELYRYRASWLAKSEEDREYFARQILGAIEQIEAAGVDIVGWGMNDVETDARADYDFFCVYKIPSFEFQREFDRNIRQSGWHDLFEQVAVSGAIQSPAAVMAANVALETPGPRT